MVSIWRSKQGVVYSPIVSSLCAWNHRNSLEDFEGYFYTRGKYFTDEAEQYCQTLSRFGRPSLIYFVNKIIQT